MHGSGKTAVLVERVIRKIVNEKIDIDKLLIVTYTNAAASQMREKILQAVYKKLEEESENTHLQRQIVLINKANISTIHSFCLAVIHDYFYEIGISPNVRIGDDSELELLKQEVIDDLFESKYEEKNKEFEKLIECYTSYKGDESLKELIFSIDEFVQSMPFPQKWLNDSAKMFKLIDKNIDFSKTIWGKILLENFKEKAQSCYIESEMLEKDLLAEGLSKSAQVLNEDQKIISSFMELQTWEKIHEIAIDYKFPNWKSDKDVISNLQEEAKVKRDSIKKKFDESIGLIKLYTSKEALEDITYMQPIIEGLKNLYIDFEERFLQAKKEKNIIDFHDIEHFAVKILEKPEIAKEFQNKFEEIAIDEYQDSNLIQDYLLNRISRGNNIFMVGDVKQSIYRFRQARPQLFIEKYNRYDNPESDGIKVLLYKNFRSRKQVLDLTNSVFEAIMSKKLGEIEYTETEYLNQGAKYDTSDEEIHNPELHIIEKMKAEEDDELEDLERGEIEGRFVAKRICELINSNYKIKDGDEYRSLTYKDIVVLLRTTKNGVANQYEKELTNQGIPTYCDAGNIYLESTEIVTILSLLKIIDNPNQDIPLVTVLRSPIYSFNDNELIQIKLHNKQGSFYEALIKASCDEEDYLKEKINNFLNSIDEYKKRQEYMPLNELIWYIYEKTGYMSYISLTPNGALKRSNLKMLFERAKDYENASFKGLYSFIHYIERMKKAGQDFGGAKMLGENENVVRIMSVHKSKGLEFPVVFVCQMGKGFNFQELYNKVLLHQEIGFGPKYINYSRQIEYSTLAREAVKELSKLEDISEEMRVLYVALTRAKEKLILVGMQKDAEKEIEEKKKLVSYFDGKKFPFELVKKYKSYLDWFELVYAKNEIEAKIHTQKELSEDISEIEKTAEPIEMEISDEEKKKLRELINWKYPNIQLASIPSKTSVTAIKKLANTEQIQGKIECELEVPEFMQEEKALTGAQKGTIMHFILQKIDLRRLYTLQEIKEFTDELVAKKMITEKEQEAVNLDKIEKFLNSELAENIRNSKQIFKEKPFYLYMPVKEIYGGETEEKIVVQGVIDLFFVDQNDEIVLVDYKTDYVENEEDLIKKYKEQLEIYQKAIEKATNQIVERKYIYSMYLNKEILVT